MKKGEKIFFLGIIIYSFAIIYASEQFAFINQGDFSRTTGKFLSSNVQFLLEWPLLENPSMPHPWEVYSVFLWLISKISKLFTNTFVLAISSVVQKIILLFIVYCLLKRLISSKTIFVFGYIVSAAILLAPHNSAIFKSFYPESFFAIGLMALVAGIYSYKENDRPILIIMGSVLCGLSKVQFFYIPAMAVVVLIFLNGKNNFQGIKKYIYVLMLIQAACFLPLANNKYSQINYYHALYLGPYVVMSDPELDEANLSEEKRLCIGVDAWGNKLTGQGGSVIQSNHKTCVDEESGSIWKIFATYIKFPSVFARMVAYSAETHFTTKYFHVDKNYLYQVSTANLGSVPIALQKISNAREFFPPWSILIFFLPIVFAISIVKKGKARLGLSCFFLLLIIFTQLIISLLGEGVRDLSKHLYGAQFSIDLIMVFTFFHGLALCEGMKDEAQQNS